MKSKAHMKKCLELGVSVTMDEAEMQEHGKILVYIHVHLSYDNKSN